MKNRKQNLIQSLLLTGAVVTMAPTAALAATLVASPNAYTPACTKIVNTAHVDYYVAGVKQNPDGGTDGVDSNQSSFYVAAKVDLLVTTTDNANVPVTPGLQDKLLGYRVTNNGNVAVKFALSYFDEAGTASPFTGTDDYTLEGETLSATSIATLAPDYYEPITLSSDTLLTATNGKIAVYGLKAQAMWIGSGGTTDITTEGNVTGTLIGTAGVCAAAAGDTIQVVLADGDGDSTDGNDGSRDGAHYARSAYVVQAANLTIAKSSAVVYDPINCSSYSPLTCTGTAKAIPGAVVEYTIKISNAASTSTATNVTVTDTVESNLTFNVDGYAAGKGLQVTAPNLYSGAATALTNAVDAPTPDEGDYTAGVVTITGISVAASEDAYARFRATIK